ncbi:MAG: Alpha-D-kanosaminyltransferase [candidate division BRC1 bacterium ADurb.BinA364]|nr:MAG: Alpha-D-kanosaminyltransferase [candidate division BRC1 bacterium ADurb.BinA364]
MLYSGDYVPPSVRQKAQAALGERAIGLRGEWKIGSEDANHLANRNFCLRFHPGLYSAIRRLKPDVMICEGFFKWTFPALLNRIAHGTPLVILYERTFHTERHAQRLRTWYRRRVVRWAGAMGCNGRLCREYTEWLGMPREKITTGHMAADTEHIGEAVKAVPQAARESLRRGMNASNLLFLYVGRLHERKGLMQLLEAWAEVERLKPNAASLALVGDGDRMDALQRYCAERALRNVHFAGRVPYGELPAYYASADAFVIPTLEDNWSLVVPEAMAAGLPVLCSKYNGCWPELVQEGANGWVFDPLDRADTLAALTKAIDGSAALPAMGECSQRIVQAHSPRAAAESIFRACQIALAEPSAAGAQARRS